MENLILFVILACIFYLYYSFYKFKEEHTYLHSLDTDNKDDYNSLKKEIDEIRKQITESGFVSENLVSKIDEIEIISKQTKENSALTSYDIVNIKDDIEIVSTQTKDNSDLTPYDIVNIKDDIEIVSPQTKDNSALTPYKFRLESLTTPTFEEQQILEEEKTSKKIEHLDIKPNYRLEAEPKPELQVREKKEYVESTFSILIKKLEHQFAENWTGILGTAIMVLGVGYLSIYTALKVLPIFRILILWFYAGILSGSYFFLKTKEKWFKTGLWLRNAGAALFLFGCFGASQIPALTFIHNIPLAYSLIGIGIAINLYVGYIIKQQTFLSLHVILSFLILCVIPEKLLITFLLASLTATAGIILSYKEKWEYHLLIVISAFIIFDIWFTQGTSILSPSQNIFAILGIILVSISCMYMQYRSIYTNTRFDRIAFITHLVNWVLFALGLILHSTGSKIKIFVLFTAAILCLSATLFARKKKITWLYHLDGMVSFLLFALSIIMLNDWSVGSDIIVCVLYLLIITCMFIMYKSKEVLLYNIFLDLNHIFCILALVFFIYADMPFNYITITNYFVTVIMMTFITLLVPVFCSMKKEYLGIDSFFFKKDLSLNGIFSVLFSILLLINWYHTIEISFYFPLFFISLLWCFLQLKFKTKSFDFGRFTFLMITIVTGIVLILTDPKSDLDIFFTLGIIALIEFNWFVKSLQNDKSITKTTSIIGINALLISLSYKYLASYDIIQIFGWFAIALLNHEFLWIQFKRKTLTTDNQILLYGFCLAFSIFGSGLFAYNTQFLNSTEIGLTAIGLSIIEIYILFADKIRNKSNAVISGWGNFNVLNSEFILFNALVFVFSCIQLDYIPVYLGGLAIATFWIFQKIDRLRRYNIYSFVLLIGGIFLSLYLAAFEANTVSKNVLYAIQAITILLSVGYSYLQMKSQKEEGKMFIAFLPVIQNLWVIALLFLQVEIAYLAPIFMLLAILNFSLILYEKIELMPESVLLIGLLSIVTSIFYSTKELNDFTWLAWVLQLSSIALLIVLVLLMNKKEFIKSLKIDYQIVINIWLSIIMLTQLEHKWLPVFWATTAIINLCLYYKKIGNKKEISIVYYLLANFHLAFISFTYYESKFEFEFVYLIIFGLLALYIFIIYKYIEDFRFRNSIIIYPATFSIGLFLYLSFDKGILTFFWILESLGLLILGIILKEKYFRYVSLSLVGVCVIRLMFFDLSNADFLIRALVLLGVGVVLLIMNTLFKKYKDRFN
ncbi:putative membrane protein DUF2339 [Flavobacterium sp. 9]|uniref:DUF2339 domain-containing protein n=1 Tax=Flavobacterium sp. 9 TaxID=2035198 RepID=UPI000C56894F|nr:DUF2339 domain-containing protein [Flavobacterium sp. 9]PIF30141.1 putative membrane protein DUF2339 [Flavobacterium sp. 9]